MARVTTTNLHRLRERLAEEFIHLMDSGEVLMKDGEPVVIDGKVIMKRPSPAMLNVIRQFLRDNGIDRDPVDVPSDKPALTKSLPFEEPEDAILLPPEDKTPGHYL